MSKAHIFVATPMYGGMCTGFFTQSLLAMSKVMKDNDIDMTFQAMFNESLIQRGRNALAHNFMKNESYTHLMFIDADIRFNPQDILKMIEEDKDIICGIYPKKEINWQGVANAASTNVPVEYWKHYTGSLVVNLVDYDGAVTVPIDKPVEIWNGGTGFMLIKRSALEHMKDKLPSYNNDVQILGSEIKDRITEFFACAIEPGSERLLSEDYYFCWKAREAGLKVYAAPWAQLGHFGTYLFEGGVLPAP
jgi:cellulose synthase/poly-beta-1,6-N-acetylglucosamine synthase-like glycosyltransferase